MSYGEEQYNDWGGRQEEDYLKQEFTDVKEEARSRSRSRRGRRRSGRRDRDREDGEGGRDRDRPRRRSGDRRRSRRRGASREPSDSVSPRTRRKRKLPGLWDSTVLAPYHDLATTLCSGDPKTRELYIGHLAPGCTPKMLEDLFNSLFQALPEYKRKYGDQPPVSKAQMYGNGTFAFVEFRSKEVAQTATKFDQCVLMNHPIHIGRPQGFVPPPPGRDPPILDITPLLQKGLIPPAPNNLAAILPPPGPNGQLTLPAGLQLPQMPGAPLAIGNGGPGMPGMGGMPMQGMNPMAGGGMPRPSAGGGMPKPTGMMPRATGGGGPGYQI